MNPNQTKAYERAGEISDKLAGVAAEFADEGYAVVVVVAHIKEKAGCVGVVGLNSHEEALPLIKMAETMCKSADAHENFKVKPITQA